MARPSRIDVLLVTGGRWHDVGYARLRLLAELDLHDAARITVRDDFEDLAALDRSDALVSYTCDVRPGPEASRALVAWTARGGRWLALHGTCAALDVLPTPAGRAFRAAPADDLSDLLGGRFVGHPPIGSFRVEVSAPTHPLVTGLAAFDTVDELYVVRAAPPVEVLLHTTFVGDCPGFVDDDGGVVRSNGPRQPLMWQKRAGTGAVTYLALGHCRGRWDLTDLELPDTGRRDRVAWSSPGFRGALARSVAWMLHGEAWMDVACDEGEC